VGIPVGTSSANDQFSPLQEIQRVEAEVASRLAGARKGMERVETEARHQALIIIREAQDQGYQEGQEAAEAIMAQAKQEAEAFLEQARQQAEGLRQKRASTLQIAAQHSLAIVVGLKGDVS
jgi:vacuolar-type H+-ATPase subunit H